MKIIIVDNETKSLENFYHCFVDDELTVVPWHEFGLRDIKGFDLIILTGGYNEPVIMSRRLFIKERKLIETTKTPLLGMCWGGELMVDTLGGSLIRRQFKQIGETEIEIDRDDPLFKDWKDKTLTVYESHRWVIEKVPLIMKPVAWSVSGIEMVRHRTRPLIACQFHPEKNKTLIKNMTDYLTNLA